MQTLVDVRARVPKDVYDLIVALTYTTVDGKPIKYRTISDVVKEAIVRGVQEMVQLYMVEGASSTDKSVERLSPRR